MIRVAYFPLKKESDYLADVNELIIDYNNYHTYIKADDGITIEQYPSKRAIGNISDNILADIKVPPGNMTGDTYTRIYDNMMDVLDWIKGVRGDISNESGISDIDKIMVILSGLEYGHDILGDIDKKVNKEVNKTLSEYNFDAYYKNKIDSVQFGANRYYHGREQQCSYVPPVTSVNEYYDHINLSIEDIDGLGDIDDGANYYEHPDDPVCYLENFGVIAVNGRSGNVTITASDIGMDKIRDYPITLSSTPKDEIDLLSYASIQGAHNVIKNKFGHSGIITPLKNTNKVEVVFITDNDILIRDNTWYVELKDLRTEGALYDYTGRAFALEEDTSYIWRLKADRDDEVATNKSGSIHIGTDDMIVMVGDGVITKDRDVIIRLDNSDNRWLGSSHRVRRFNIRRSDGRVATGPIIATANKSGNTFSCKLPDGKYAAELIYFDENNDLGRGVKDVDYQVDMFEVKYNETNKIYVDIKNQNYIPPNYANVTITLNALIKKLSGEYVNINDQSRVEIRLRDGSYKLHDTSNPEGIRYRAGDLYNEAKDKFEGRVIYTDTEGNEYDPVSWEIDRSYTINKYSFNIYVTEIEIGFPHSNLLVLVEDPITFKDMSLNVNIKDIKSGRSTNHMSTTILNDNSKQHMTSDKVDNYLLFSFDDIIIDEGKIYYGTIYSDGKQVSNTIVIGQTSDNQFEFDPIRSSISSVQNKYNNSNNILNMASPSLVSDVDGFNRYEDVRVYLKGSPNAIKNAKIEIKRSYIDELTNNTMFTRWEDITKDRAIKIYPNELWSGGNRSSRSVQYSIRVRGDNIKVVEREDNINPYSSGKLKVHTVVTEFEAPPIEPPKPPEPGKPEETTSSNLVMRVSPPTFKDMVGVVRRRGDNNPWILGIPISDNSTQHFFELNGRRSVDNFIEYEFNIKLKPQEILDVGVMIRGTKVILKSTRSAIRGDYRGYPEVVSSDISKVSDNKFSYDISEIPHKDRFNDIRFVVTPPDAKIEYYIDSWASVRGRRLTLFKNINTLPIRVSAYGYLTHEGNVYLLGDSMKKGRVEVAKVDLRLSPVEARIWIKVEYERNGKYLPTYNSSSANEDWYSFDIFDKGKWVKQRMAFSLSLVGEGHREIRPSATYSQRWMGERREVSSKVQYANTETYIYNVGYVDRWGPGVPGYTADNPIVIRIPIK